MNQSMNLEAAIREVTDCEWNRGMRLPKALLNTRRWYEMELYEGNGRNSQQTKAHGKNL